METIQLGKWVERYSQCREEAVLVTQSIRNGNELLRRYASKGTYGIRVSRLVDIAFSLALKALAEDSAKEDGTVRPVLISNTDAMYRMEKLVLEKTNDPSFFIPRKSVCAGALTDLLGQINQIRMGKSKGDVTMETPASDRRVKAVLELRKDFENDLQASGSNVMDGPLAYQIALTYLKNHPEEEKIHLGISEALNLTYIEKEFAEAVSDDAVTVIIGREEDDVYRTLHAVFMPAYGIVNEVKACADHIREERLAPGNTAVFYTDSSYEPYIQMVFDRMKIPFHIVSPRPADDLTKIQLIRLLLNWAANDFLYEDLRQFFTHPYVTLKAFDEKSESDKENGFAMGSGSAYFKGIRDGIGWGRQRFINNLSLRHEETEETTERMKPFRTCLAELAAPFEDPIDPVVLFDGIVAAVKKCLPKRMPENTLASPACDAVRRYLEEQETGVVKLEAAIRKILSILDNVKIQDAEAADAVCMSALNNPIVTNRKNVFIIGLSNGSFMPELAQSPSVRDEEMAELIDDRAGYVHYADNNGREKEDAVIRTIRFLKDDCRLYIGYSSFDAIDMREDSASPLYLKLRDSFVASSEDPEHYYTADKSGVKYVFEREDAGTEDSEPEQAKFISPSAFATLLSCPLHYCYRYLRYLPEEEYKKKDYFIWLSNTEKGSYFHRLMELYCNAVLKGKEAPEELDEDVLNNIFENTYREFRDKVASPSDSTAKREKRDIERACRIYLACLHKELRESGWTVMECEKDIGKVPISYEDPEGEEKQIVFIGRLDRVDLRIDKNGLKHFRVIDYKTGDPKYYRKKVNNGGQIQHFVYAAALEDQGIVDEVEYVFPLEMTFGESESSGPEKIVISGDKLTELPEKDTFFYDYVVTHQAWTRADLTGCPDELLPSEMTVKFRSDSNPKKNYILAACKYCAYGTGGFCPLYRKSERYEWNR